MLSASLIVTVFLSPSLTLNSLGFEGSVASTFEVGYTPTVETFVTVFFALYSF